jgi:hypothetical protein
LEGVGVVDLFDEFEVVGVFEVEVFEGDLAFRFDNVADFAEDFGVVVVDHVVLDLLEVVDERGRAGVLAGGFGVHGGDLGEGVERLEFVSDSLGT